MPPKVLILVAPLGRTVVPVREAAEWDGQACARCGRRIEHDPAVFLVGDELRCARCVTKPSFDACLWCGQPGSRRDSGPPLDPGGHPEGEVFCQPCWTIYVAYVEDVLERGEQGDPFRDLLEEMRRVVAREHPDGA